MISLSFANVKEATYEFTRYKLFHILEKLYIQNSFLLDSEVLTERDKDYFQRICVGMNDGDATMAIHQLCDYLYRYYGKKVIILLDEYDTPMQEAYVHGFWDKAYAAVLEAKGIPKERIRKYGFAFEGKNVLIG